MNYIRKGGLSTIYLIEASSAPRLANLKIVSTVLLLHPYQRLVPGIVLEGPVPPARVFGQGSAPLRIGREVNFQGAQRLVFIAEKEADKGFHHLEIMRWVHLW